MKIVNVLYILLKCREKIGNRWKRKHYWGEEAKGEECGRWTWEWRRCHVSEGGGPKIWTSTWREHATTSVKMSELWKLVPFTVCVCVVTFACFALNLIASQHMPFGPHSLPSLHKLMTWIFTSKLMSFTFFYILKDKKEKKTLFFLIQKFWIEDIVS